MYELELELDDSFIIEDVLPKWEVTIPQNRFWVYKTAYQGKVSYLTVDMEEKKRFLFSDDPNDIGSIYILEEGELFDIEYIADFNNWNAFINKFPDLKKMANITNIVLSADIERESDDY